MSDLNFAKLLTKPAKQGVDEQSTADDSDIEGSDNEDYDPLSATVEMSEALGVRRLLLERIAAETNTILDDPTLQEDQSDALKTRKKSVKALQIVTDRTNRLFESWEEEGAKLIQVSKTLQNRPDKAIDLWARDWESIRIDNKIEEYGDANQAVSLSDQGVSNQLKSLCNVWRTLHKALCSQQITDADGIEQASETDENKLGPSLAEAFKQLNRETLLLAYTIFEVSKPGHRDSDDEEVYTAGDDDWSSDADRRYKPSRSLVGKDGRTLATAARVRLSKGKTEGSVVLREVMLAERQSADAAVKAAAEAEKAAHLAAEKADLRDFVESDDSTGTSDEDYQPRKRLKRGPELERDAPRLRSTGAGARNRRRCVIDSDDE